MARLTSLSFEDAQSALRSYGLVLVELEPLDAGSVNSNFFIEACSSSGSSSYFARIYEEQEQKGARFELLLNETLDRAGLPVAKPVRLKDGSLTTTIEGKPFALYERLRGEIFCQKMVTPQVAREVGRALARVHLAPLGDLEIGPSRFDFDGIRSRLERVKSAGRADLLPAVERLAKTANFLQRARPTNLPQGLIHGDLFRDNVLIRDGQVAGLLDFESASWGSFAYDLMVTLLAWCFAEDLEPNLTRAMVEGYVSKRPLTDEERDALVIEGSVACVRFATTRLTDFSLRIPLGQKPARDYRRFFERLEALDSGRFDQAIRGVV